MTTQQTAAPLEKIIFTTLEDHKALEINLFDVRHLTSITDHMIICTGTSTRHAKALSDYVIEAAKNAGTKPLGVEGEREAEWILVDLGSVVVHIMLPAIRQFYHLEKLWDSVENAAENTTDNNKSSAH